MPHPKSLGDDHIIEVIQQAQKGELLEQFHYTHLPDHLREVSRPFAELALSVCMGPMNFEQLESLRMLLAAKDAAVRSIVLARKKADPQSSAN